MKTSYYSIIAILTCITYISFFGSSFASTDSSPIWYRYTVEQSNGTSGEIYSHVVDISHGSSVTTEWYPVSGKAVPWSSTVPPNLSGNHTEYCTMSTAIGEYFQNLDIIPQDIRFNQFVDVGHDYGNPTNTHVETDFFVVLGSTKYNSTMMNSGFYMADSRYEQQSQSLLDCKIENTSATVTHTTTVQNLSPPEWPPCCSPVILSQVELASQFKFLPDNLTCTSQPAIYPQHSCLTNLVPNHKVECSYISGNSCEPLHQYTSGTNKNCFGDSVQPISSGTQWFDLYNTQNKTAHLQYFGYKLTSGYSMQVSDGGGFDIGPYEKCTLVLSNNYSQGALEVKPVNMTIQVSYYYDGKPYTTATPSLTDTYNDSGTWQFDGNKWVFAEQNTIAVPEFPFAVPVMLIGIISTIVFYGMRFRK